MTLVTDRPGHDRRYAVDCSKLKALGWDRSTRSRTGSRHGRLVRRQRGLVAPAQGAEPGLPRALPAPLQGVTAGVPPVRVLVTGVGGFVGGHFVDFLRPAASAGRGLRHRPPRGGALRARGGILERGPRGRPARREAAIDQAQPRPHRPPGRPVQCPPLLEGPRRRRCAPTSTGLLHLLEAVRAARSSPRVLVVGSAEEYGAVRPRRPADARGRAAAPDSPYAVSKVAQGYLALQYALSFSMGVIRTRTFHYTGPGRGEAFAESSFARQLAEIEAGRRRAAAGGGQPRGRARLRGRARRGARLLGAARAAAIRDRSTTSAAAAASACATCSRC